MNYVRQGIFKENSVFVLALGLCPALAVTTQAINGLGMGIAILVVLAGANAVISLVRSYIPATVRIPIFIVIISSFTAIVELVMEAWTPGLAEALGIFLPLIAVNCIIFARAELFASKNSPLPTMLDAAGVTIGYTLALLLLACIRELFGNGTITLELLGLGSTLHFPFFEEHKAIIMVLPPGAFLTLGLLMGFFNLIRRRTMGTPNAYTYSDAHISHKRQELCNGGSARGRKK